MQRLRDNRLTLAILYMAFTCVPAYKAFTVTPRRIRHILHFIPRPPAPLSNMQFAVLILRGLWYFNLLLLAGLVCYTIYKRPRAALSLLPFAIYAISWQAMGATNKLISMTLVTLPVFYLASSDTENITRQVINAGWFVWCWTLAGMVVMVLLLYKPHGGFVIAFRPAQAAALFAMLLPWGVEIENDRARRAYLLLGALTLASMFWRVRVSIVAAAALAAGYIWTRYTRYHRVMLIIFIIIAVVGIYGLAQVRIHTVMMRIELWRDAAQIWREHPLFGAGFGSFRVYSEIENAVAEKAHSGYFTLLAEGGMVWIMLLALAIIIIWRSRHYRSAGANLSLLALAAVNLTEDILFLWFIAALTAAALAVTDWGAWRENEHALSGIITRAGQLHN